MRHTSLSRSTLTAALVLAAVAASNSSADPAKKLVIGGAAEKIKIEGFSVEDLRAESAKKSSIEQTKDRSWFAASTSNDTTRTVYKINFGDADLNVAPTELFVGKLASRLGDKLTGKTLLLHEFAITAVQTSRWPQPTPTERMLNQFGVLGAIAQIALAEPRPTGDLLHLDIRIVAELGSLRFEGHDYQDLLYRDGYDQGKAAVVVDAAMENAIYNLHRAEVAAEAEKSQGTAAQGSE
jgi:hypothetical protein